MATSHLFKQVEEQGSKWREEQAKARDPLQNPLGKAALAAGLGYITGGVLPALLPGGTTVAAAGPATAAGVGATADIGLPAAFSAGLTPSAANVLPAIEAATQGATAASPEEAAFAGLKSGVQPVKEAYTQKLLGDKLGAMGLPKIPTTATVDKEGNVSSTYKTTQPTKEMTDYQKNWLALQEKKLQKAGRGGSDKNAAIGNLGAAGQLVYTAAISELTQGSGTPEAKLAALKKISETTKLPAKEKAIITKAVNDFKPKKVTGGTAIDFSGIP